MDFYFKVVTITFYQNNRIDILENVAHFCVINWTGMFILRYNLNNYHHFLTCHDTQHKKVYKVFESLHERRENVLSLKFKMS